MFYWILFKWALINTLLSHSWGTNNGAETAYPSRVSAFTSDFRGLRVATCISLVFYVKCRRSLFVLLTIVLSVLRFCSTFLEIMFRIKLCCTFLEIMFRIKLCCTFLEIMFRIKLCCTFLEIMFRIKLCCTFLEIMIWIKLCCTIFGFLCLFV